MAFASKLSFRLLFKFLLLENMVQQNLQLYCSLNYKTVALFNQLSNCKRNILNRDPHFMLTITPSLSTVTGKVSECFLRAKRSKIQYKRIALAWGSSRCSMLQVRTRVH